MSRIAVADTLMTWPSLSIRLDILPWHWRLIPRVWTDFDCTSSCSFEWLAIKIEWFANRPLFTVEHEGCDCVELCSMGPTCPGGMLAGLAGSGCWRTKAGA